MKYAIFDLDMTIFNTPSPMLAEIIGYEKVLPLKEKHKQWWSDPKSLDPEFNIPAHDLIVSYINQYNNDPDWYTVLITHRDTSLKNNIIKLLKKYKLQFDKVIITFRDKEEILFSKVPQIKNAEEIVVYEDSLKNLYRYKIAFDIKKLKYTLKLATLTDLITLSDFNIINIEKYDMFFI